MADSQSTKRLGIGLLAGLVAVLVGVRFCSKRDDAKQTAETAAPSASTTASGSTANASDAGGRLGLSSPIAATHSANGDVIVAGVETATRSLHVQRFDAQGKLVGDRAVLGAVSVTNDSELKIAAQASDGLVLTWRGLRREKQVRQLVVLGTDLIPRGEPMDVTGASCVTREAIWLTDGTNAISRPWGNGPGSRIALPKDDDASLLCSPGRAFAVLDGEERTSILSLVATDAKPAPLTVLRESDFGDDEQRELSEYTVGDDVGFVRVGSSGAISIREVSGDALRPLRKLKTLIPKDDDVVAVDASEKEIAIVYTQDASTACPQSATASPVSTKVTVLRVDRATLEESTVEISPGRCGDDIGPFFTGAVGDSVSVAWTERRGGPGRARAPIVGLAYSLVGLSGSPVVSRVEQPADAVADGGCDANGCYAAVLPPRDDVADGAVRVLRYNNAK